MSDLGDDEKRLFKQAAGHVLSLSDEHLSELVARGEFVEVFAHDKEISK